MDQPRWLAQAWAELGQAERPGASDNPRILAFYRDVGHENVRRDEVAWCAAFLGACLERAGFASTRSLMARSYLPYGRDAQGARLGAIAVLSRTTNPALGHVGFVVGETTDKIFLLGGNQGDAVSVAAFARSRVLGYRWPETGEDPTDEASSGASGSDARLEASLSHVLQMEGGWSNDPHDPGGPTNQGITLSVFASHLGQRLDADSQDELIAALRRITPHTVREIYERRYWRPSRAVEMPAGLGLMHFDASVNHGLTGAARLLQEALGVEIDGEIGPVTLRAAQRQDEQHALGAYADARRRKYRSLPHFWRFGRGWLARVDKTLNRSLALAATPIPKSGPILNGEIPMTDATTYEPISDPVQDTKWWAESMTIWGTIITTLSTVLPVVGPVFGLDITGELVRQIGADVVQIAQAVGGLVGTLMTVMGRMRATSRISLRELNIRV